MFAPKLTLRPAPFVNPFPEMLTIVAAEFWPRLFGLRELTDAAAVTVTLLLSALAVAQLVLTLAVTRYWYVPFATLVSLHEVVDAERGVVPVPQAGV
jgi:hypothetical protein